MVLVLRVSEKCKPESNVATEQPAAATAGVKSIARMVPTRAIRQEEQKVHRGGGGVGLLGEHSLLPPALKSPSSASYWQSLTGTQLIKEN